MVNRFGIIRRTPRTAVWFIAILASGLAANVMLAQTDGVKWDPAASQDLEQAYHRLHDSWNKMDVAALKKLIVGDDVLATFDLDPGTNEPIKLTSKAEMDVYTDKIFDLFKASDTKVVAKHPMINCRATSELGVCTEECTIHLYLPNGDKEVQLLRGTAVAVKFAEGWRFIHWHMSEAGPTTRTANSEAPQSR